MTSRDGFASRDDAKVEVDADGKHFVVTQSGKNNLYPDHIDGPIFVITAFNPGRELSAEINDARQRWFEADLDRQNRRWFPSRIEGVADASENVMRATAITDVTRAEALELGTSVGQDTVFEWTRDHLVVLRCPTPTERGVAQGTLRSSARELLLFPCILDDGTCRRYASGHLVHPIQAREIGQAPWGWRDALVLGADSRYLRLAFVNEQVEFDAWNHDDLSAYLPPGAPVRMNRGLLQAGNALFFITHNSPLSPIPTPKHPELWAPQATPVVVDVATGRGVDVSAPEPEVP